MFFNNNKKEKLIVLNKSEFNTFYGLNNFRSNNVLYKLHNKLHGLFCNNSVYHDFLINYLISVPHTYL
jgi:hypothetical protein